MSEPKNILQEAYELVNGVRQADYGHPAVDFARTAKMWSALFGVEIQSWQVPLAMIALKMSRLTNDPTKRDTVLDIAGYAATFQMVMEYQGAAREVPIPDDEVFTGGDKN